jgi:hypothetical protein
MLPTECGPPAGVKCCDVINRLEQTQAVLPLDDDTQTVAAEQPAELFDRHRLDVVLCEGSAKAPHVGAFVFTSTCRFSRVRWVWSRLWSFRLGEGLGRARPNAL